MTPGGDDWTEVELGQLGSVVTGRTPPKAEPELFGVEYPFFTPSDMSYGDRSPPTERFISEAGAIRFRRIRLPVGSTCFVCIGATIGKVCLTSQPSFTNQQLNSIIPEEAHHDPRFVYYLLVSVAEDIKALASGAATPIINKSSFSAFKVKVPPLPTQQRISSILSAYDDLIENNTRRIAILEEMARRLYEEWFVHFRFPGNEQTEFDGDLPKGWRSAVVGDLVEERRDAVQPQVIDPETPYVGLEHIPRRSITLREWSISSTVQSTKLAFQENDILFGKIRPYFHKVCVSPVTGVTSSDAIVLRALSADHLSLAIFCISSEPFVDHATQTSNGTKMPRADWKVLKRYSVAVPSGELLARFNSFILPLLQNLKQLNQKNTNLRAQRDMLLPKLVSGEIGVSGAEAAMEAAE